MIGSMESHCAGFVQINTTEYKTHNFCFEILPMVFYILSHKGAPSILNPHKV